MLDKDKSEMRNALRAQLDIRMLLKQMKLKEIMVKSVIQAAPEETIGVAAKRMRESAVGCLVVTVAGAVKGIITDRDLLACLAQGHDPYLCKISTHMQRPVHVLRPEEDHATAAEVMRARRIKRLPIAQNGNTSLDVLFFSLGRGKRT